MLLSTSIIDVCVVNNEIATVTIGYNKTLETQDLSDTNAISVKETVKLDFATDGITSYEDKIIVSTLRPKTLKMLNISGEEIWSFTKEAKFFNCNVFKGKPAVTVSDWSKNRLTVLDIETGEIIKLVDIEDKGSMGITADHDGNTYICYSRPCEVAVWSPELDDSRVILSRKNNDLRPKVFNTLNNKVTKELIVTYGDRETIDVFKLAHQEDMTGDQSPVKKQKQ